MIHVLISPSFIFFYIIIFTAIITTILRKKLEKDTVNLINSIAILPAIPLLWLMIYENNPSMNSFFSFYFPLIISIFAIVMLVIRIVKYMKR